MENDINEVVKTHCQPMLHSLSQKLGVNWRSHGVADTDFDNLLTSYQVPVLTDGMFSGIFFHLNS